jgi:hypothetical protein
MNKLKTQMRVNVINDKTGIGLDLVIPKGIQLDKAITDVVRFLYSKEDRKVLVQSLYDAMAEENSEQAEGGV